MRPRISKKDGQHLLSFEGFLPRPHSAVCASSSSSRRPPLFVAIVGGSGSGKSWLAHELQLALGRCAIRLSLDDFYRDRSHLLPAKRDQLNFDRPESIDWSLFEQVLLDCFQWRSTRVPRYDYKTHCRRAIWRRFDPKPIILVDGLWVLRKPPIRRLFQFRIFIECPVATRFQRRLTRDRIGRGRTSASVRRQFWKTVQPMHRQFVNPQRRWAHAVLRRNWGRRHVCEIAALLEQLCPAAHSS